METNVKCPYCGGAMFVESIDTDTEAEKVLTGRVRGLYVRRTTTLRCDDIECHTEVRHNDYVYKSLK